MKRLFYKCTLLTDLVITSKAATEGFHRSLDYIPGAKFLGLVAGDSRYDMKQEKRTLDLFHNGSVRFDDAHPYIEDERLYKIPASWYLPKGREEEGRIFLYHNMSRDQKGQSEKAGAGYFSQRQKKAIGLGQKFSIKSAFDADKRRSKDQQMYGYFGLEKGTEWSFTVEFQDEQYVETVDEALLGKRRIGRSKSAEYGLVKIERLPESPTISPAVAAGEAYLYAQSNLCFYDQYGRCTVKPDAGQLSLPAGSEILWNKSQIRSRFYRTWNQHRKNRDADRLIIEKGSVFALELGEPLEAGHFEQGVGAHLSEGFGRVLVNPSFLPLKEETLAYQLSDRKTFSKTVDTYLREKGEDDELVLAFLDRRQDRRQQGFHLNKMVNKFIRNNPAQKYDQLSSSQWGQVRKYAKGSKNGEILKSLLFDENFGFFHRGQSESEWRRHGRRKHFKQFLFEDRIIPPTSVIEFVVKLSAEMAKISKKGVE